MSKAPGNINFFKFSVELWRKGEQHLSKYFSDSVNRTTKAPLVVSDLLFVDFKFKCQLKLKNSF